MSEVQAIMSEAARYVHWLESVGATMKQVSIDFEAGDMDFYFSPLKPVDFIHVPITIPRA